MDNEDIRREQQIASKSWKELPRWMRRLSGDDTPGEFEALKERNQLLEKALELAGDYIYELEVAFNKAKPVRSVDPRPRSGKEYWLEQVKEERK